MTASLLNFLQKKQNYKKANYSSYIPYTYQAEWSERNYHQFCLEGYISNVICYRAINMVAKAAASAEWYLYQNKNGKNLRLNNHPALALLTRPSHATSCNDFFEQIYSYLLISGNAYIALTIIDNRPYELNILRPDRVEIVPGQYGYPVGYKYKIGDYEKFYPYEVDNSNVLHLKQFNPINDWYGLSPVEAAAYAIDQHNQAAKWNQSLLQNGARPSGALIIKNDSNYPGFLTDDQFERIKREIEESYTGSRNSGRPLLLEGGVEWKEMGLSNRDMDFMEAKHTSAREIALAFGVPPQLLGIPGDNTYSNMQEARLALWEQTILPLLDYVQNELNHWLAAKYQENISFVYNKDNITALAPRRQRQWERINNADFLTINEKRELLGFPPLKEGSILSQKEKNNE